MFLPRSNCTPTNRYNKIGPIGNERVHSTAQDPQRIFGLIYRPNLNAKPRAMGGIYECS